LITRINSLELLSTRRTITFEPGLNIIAGPITTGKTSLIRLCRVLLGSPVEDLTPEVRANVPAISGSLTLGESRFSVVREMVSTETSKVEISGDGVALRLPALRRDASAPTTYGRWLLNRLGLPEIEAVASLHRCNFARRRLPDGSV
jgi:AAA domain